MANQYAAVMDLWFQLQESIAPTYLQLRYEDRVADIVAIHKSIRLSSLTVSRIPQATSELRFGLVVLGVLIPGFCRLYPGYVWGWLGMVIPALSSVARMELAKSGGGACYGIILFCKLR